MRSYGWGPDLIGPVPLKDKEKTAEHSVLCVKTQQEGGCLQAKGRALTRNQTLAEPDLWLPASITVGN